MKQLWHGLVALVALGSVVAPAYADCVDEQEKKKLIEAKRGRRADERDFVTTGRHEISILGGYYVSDLLDGTYVVGLAYTYHMTEDFGVEGSFDFTQNHSSVSSRLEHDRGVAILPKVDRVYMAFTDLIWAPLHGKMRLFADTILHFDFFAAAGVGVLDNATSAGAAGQVGLGGKVYLGQSWALRLDVRDTIYQQQVLAVKQYVQDFSVTLGVSVFIPSIHKAE